MIFLISFFTSRYEHFDTNISQTICSKSYEEFLVLKFFCNKNCLLKQKTKKKEFSLRNAYYCLKYIKYILIHMMILFDITGMFA